MRWWDFRYRPIIADYVVLSLSVIQRHVGRYRFGVYSLCEMFYSDVT